MTKSNNKMRKGGGVGRSAVSSQKVASVAMGVTTKTFPPMISQAKDGLTVRLRGSERFSSVVIDATGGATVSTYDKIHFSPADGALRWLPNLAKAYSAYHVHNLVFRYVPIVPTSQGGQVTMGWFRDPNDGNRWILSPSSADLEVTGKAQTGPAWEGAIMRFNERELHQAKPWFEVGSSTAPTAQAIAGTFGVAAVLSSTLASGTLTLGRIYIDYDITLANPVSVADNVDYRVNEDGTPGRETKGLPVDPDA